MLDLPVNDRLIIPASELRIAFARSGGPGGQNVNKVESKVQLRWNPGASAAIAPHDREWLLHRISHRLTDAGDLVITSSRTREQVRNREDARARLVQVIAAALERPKVRKRTRPSRRAVERRIESKKERARVKINRRRPLPE